MHICSCGCSKILSVYCVLCHKKEMFIQYMHLVARPTLVVKTATMLIFVWYVASYFHLVTFYCIWLSMHGWFTFIHEEILQSHLLTCDSKKILATSLKRMSLKLVEWSSGMSTLSFLQTYVYCNTCTNTSFIQHLCQCMECERNFHYCDWC